jgi:hypothetical protein
MAKHAIVLLLFLESDLMVVLSGIGIVEIHQLRNVLHSLVGHFQNGNADGHVVGCSQVVPLIVLEVGLLNVQEQLGVKCSEVTGHEGISPVLVVPYCFKWKRSRVTDAFAHVQKICIDEPSSFLLKYSAVELEDLATYKLVVAVDNQEDVLGLAILLSRHAEVGHGSLLLLVLDDHVALRRQSGLLLEELFDLVSGVVGAGVVDEDDVVVGVVLHDDGLHVLDVPFECDVVEGRHHDAEGQFLVLAYVVLLLKVESFFDHP